MITSLENSKIKYLQKLALSKFRKKEQCFVVEGAHLVCEARNLGLLIEAYSLEEKEGYIAISKALMKSICHTDTVVSEIGLCKMTSATKTIGNVLILDGIQDPGNMGALLRSACAFGFKTIFIAEGSCDIYNPKVIRSSQGAIFKLQFIFGNIVDYILSLKKYSIYGTNVVKGIDVRDITLNQPVGLILGNEGNGISKPVQDLNLNNIYIPMQQTESLNVAVAGSILMYELNNK
ncbi:MAG: RNA methyltransferase [Anaeroplasmataceae bacterium]|nr:RNA methyltransferase [Anaeroplasmataceae bacterium]